MTKFESFDNKKRTMKYKLTSGILIGILLLFFGFTAIHPELNNAFNNREEGDSYKVYALKLPETLDFSSLTGHIFSFKRNRKKLNRIRTT